MTQPTNSKDESRRSAPEHSIARFDIEPVSNDNPYAAPVHVEEPDQHGHQRLVVNKGRHEPNADGVMILLGLLLPPTALAAGIAAGHSHSDQAFILVGGFVVPFEAGLLIYLLKLGRARFSWPAVVVFEIWAVVVGEAVLALWIAMMAGMG